MLKDFKKKQKANALFLLKFIERDKKKCKMRKSG